MGSIALEGLESIASKVFVPKGNLLVVGVVVEEALEKELFKSKVLQEDLLVVKALVE